MRPMTRVVVVGFLGALGAGCAPALAGLQPATTVPHKHVEGNMAYGVSVPVVGVIAGVTEAKNAAEKAEAGEELTPKERDRIIKTVVGLGLNPPSVGNQYQLAYGIAPNAQLDLRYALSSWRLGARYQFRPPVKGETDTAATAGIGVSRYTLGIPGLPSILKRVADVDDFERYDVDVPVLWGISHDVLHVWAGPKIVASFYDASVRVCTDVDTNSGDCIERASASLNGRSFYGVGQAGAALGYRYVWVAAELNVAYVDTQMSGKVSDGTNSEFRRYHFNDVIIYPVVGLIIRI